MDDTDSSFYGTKKTEWKNIRSKFELVDKDLTRLIDNLSPGKEFPIYRLHLAYGSLKGDTRNSYIPLESGTMIPLADRSINKDISENLGYGSYSSPLGIILDKHLEYFIEIGDQVVPFFIDGPGSIFNRSLLVNQTTTRKYTPNGILKAVIGSRTAFMLPSINNHNGINKLSKRVGANLTPPRKSIEHFDIFKEINRKNRDWRAILAYFSKSWIEALSKDSAWSELKNYILEGKSNNESFGANSIYYDLFFAKAQKDRNLRTSSPYLTNTAIHLIKLALGEHPGYIPCTNENLLPLNHIQRNIADAFQLKKAPTVMVPHSLVYEREILPVYYSLQNPTAPHFLAKRNEKVTANQEIEVIHSILSKFIDEMTKSESMLLNTVLEDVAKNVSFNYFHNCPPKDSELIRSSKVLAEKDPRFTFCSGGYSNIDFSCEGQFLRGCVEIAPLRN